MTIKDHLTPWDLKLTPDPGQADEQQRQFHATYHEENEAFLAAMAGNASHPFVINIDTESGP